MGFPCTTRLIDYFEPKNRKLFSPVFRLGSLVFLNCMVLLKPTKSQSTAKHFDAVTINAKRFGLYVRGHWAIESTLHWCLDVTFREDECRVRNRNSANNLAWLKRFVLSLIKQQKDKHSVAMSRRIAGWNLSYLAQVLRIPTV